MPISPSYSPVFTRFSDLPVELRLKIWHLISSWPRNVHIKYRSRLLTFGHQSIYKFTGWRSPTPLPVVFHINHESRAEANNMLAIKPQFGTRFYDPRVYFDFERDTLIFGDGTGNDPKPFFVGVFVEAGDREADNYDMVQRMSLDIPRDSHKRSSIWFQIKKFKGLKELAMYTWEEYAWNSDVERNHLMHCYQQDFSKMMSAYSGWNPPKVTIKTPPGSIWGVLRRNEEEAAA